MKKQIIFFTVIILLSVIWRTGAAKVDTLVVKSVAVGRDVKVLAIIPNQTDKTTCYPVVYLLHGYGGNAESWIKTKPNLTEIADKMGIIFICPDGGNSWYMDSPVRANSRYETFIIKELVPYVDANLNSVKERKGRAITGNSMGGYGAITLAIKHKDLFGAVGSTSGGLDIRPFPKNWELDSLLGDQSKDKETWNSYTPINMIESICNGDLAIVIDCGYGDFFFDVNNAFHNKLLARGIMHDYYVRSGEHTHSYWNNSIEYQILFFSNFFKQ